MDITSYLEDAGTIHGEKVLTVVFGMDCVPHDEIVPYRTHITRPIVHNLFGGLFECTAVEDNGNFCHSFISIVAFNQYQLIILLYFSDLIFSIRKEPSFLIGQHSNCILNQLKPHFAYRETTDGIRVEMFSILFSIILSKVSVY